MIPKNVMTVDFDALDVEDVSGVIEKVYDKNKKVILEGLDAIIAKLKTESDGSQQHQKDIIAYELLREQYKAENIEAIRHTYNFVMDTYLREMLPEECGETLGFKRIK